MHAQPTTTAEAKPNLCAKHAIVLTPQKELLSDVPALSLSCSSQFFVYQLIASIQVQTLFARSLTPTPARAQCLANLNYVTLEAV